MRASVAGILKTSNFPNVTLRRKFELRLSKLFFVSWDSFHQNLVFSVSGRHNLPYVIMSDVSTRD